MTTARGAESACAATTERRRLVVPLALLGALSLALRPGVAHADELDLGTGRDGELVVSGPLVVNRYAALAADAGAGSVELAVAFGAFQAGELVMLHETQDSSLGVYDTATVTTFFLDDRVGVGRWELARVAVDLGGGRCRLERPLARDWRAAGSQVLSVPEYTSVVVADGGVLTGKPWDSRSGGLVALLVRGSLEVGEGGAIVADGLGFRGGGASHLLAEGISATSFGMSQPAMPTVSGGNDGSGGSNAGRGGNAQHILGGVPLAATPGERLLLGGGGGGAGGRGGGAIFLRAGSASLAGFVGSDGLGGRGGGGSTAAGGGGAGGTIDLRAAGAVWCHQLSASGGAGGPNSSFDAKYVGGGGGGGRVFVEGFGVARSCAAAARAGLRGGPQDGLSSGAAPASVDDPLYVGEVVLVDRGSGGGSVSITAPASGAVLRTRRPAFAGTADGGAVTVFVDGARVGAGPVAADGTFLVLSQADLEEGSHEALAEADDGARSRLARFTVDTVPPAAPELDAPLEGASLEPGPLAVAGRAAAGALVRLVLDGVDRGAALSGADGRFVAALEVELAVGEHVLRAVVADEAGNEAFDERRFTVRAPGLRALRTGCGCAAPGAPLDVALGLAGLLALSAVLAPRRAGTRPPGACRSA